MQIAPRLEWRKPHATIALLTERYPDTFTTELAKVRPLAIGISQTLTLFCSDIPPKQLKMALRAYCGHGTYLRAMVEGAARIDLDGAPSGVVTAGEARHAGELIAALAARDLAAARQAARAKDARDLGDHRDHLRPGEAVPSGSVAGPRRLGLADLKAAAAARRAILRDEGGVP
jgi:ProP effector